MEKLVPPGGRVATIEEFEPQGDYEIRDGEIIAVRVSRAVYDKREKVVRITPLRRQPISVGDVVVGKVVHMQSQFAYVDIYFVNGERFHSEMTGLIYVSEGRDRVPFNVGSMVRARVVLNNAGHYILSINGEGLGVVEAYCSFCGGPLIRTYRGGLRCQWCGKVHRFRVTPDFRPRKIFPERVSIE